MGRWFTALEKIRDSSREATPKTLKTGHGAGYEGFEGEASKEYQKNLPDGADVSTVLKVAPQSNPEKTSHPEALLALLHVKGPTSYGAAASQLGWGATRAWQADAALRADGRARSDYLGRLVIVEGAQ